MAPLAGGDPSRYAELAALLALLVGGAYFLARVVRLGWVADYLSRAAVVGFVHGVVVVLICGQLAKLTGIAIEADQPIGQVGDLLSGLDELSVTTLVTGLVALVSLFVLRRLSRRIPAPLIVVVVAIAVSAAAGLDEHGVATLGHIPSGLPQFELPSLRVGDVLDLALPALGILFATYSDSILTARTFAGKHQQHVDADQELLALGVANVTASITQSFPMGNSNSRTAVNEEMGVRTQVAGLVSAAAVAAVLLFLTEPVAELPSTVLGAVIVYAAIGLVSLTDWRAIRVAGRGDFVIALAAMAGVVLLGVLEGILIAVVLSILHVVRRSARPHDAVLGWVPRLGRYADVKLHRSAEVTDGVVVYRLDDRLFFAERGLRDRPRARGPGRVTDPGPAVRLRRRRPRQHRQHRGGEHRGPARRLRAARHPVPGRPAQVARAGSARPDGDHRADRQGPVLRHRASRRRRRGRARRRGLTRRQPDDRAFKPSYSSWLMAPSSSSSLALASSAAPRS